MNITTKIKNALKYIKQGGVVYTQVTTLQENERFKGKRVLVTGGGSGIGLEIARNFLKEGAEVIITGRNQAKLNQVATELNTNMIHTTAWDISNISEMKERLSELVNKIGNIDIFINNAGVYSSVPWNQVNEQEYEKMIGTNERGLFFICQAEAEYLISKKHEGKIINITSIRGIQTGFDPYSISKWGANCITKGLAKELIKHGIIVNGIAPGVVLTDISEWSKHKKEDNNKYDNSSLSKRYTLVEEIASLTLFLSSNSANNIVGQVIAVDGGITTA